MIQKLVLYKSSLTGILQLLIATLLTLFAIRVFTSFLGYEKYGIFSIITVIGNLNIFTNLGLSTALLKFVSEQGKTKESGYDIIVALLILLSILTPFTITLYFLGSVILNDFFKIPSNLFIESIELYNFMLIANFIVLIGQLFTSVIDALQKIYITNLLQILYNFLYWGGILVVILLNFSLPTVGFSITIASLIWLITSIVIYRKLWGRITYDGLFKNFFRIFKKQLSYSIKIYISGVINFFYEPLTKILISILFGVKEVGYFDIALKIRTQFWSLMSKTLYPLLPLIAGIKDEKQIGFIVNDVEQKLFYLILPIIAILIICTYSFVNIWLGSEVFIISIGIIIIVCSYMVGSTVIPNYYYLMARQVNKTIILQFSNAIANVIIILALHQYIGYYSVLVGFPAAILTSFTLSLYYQNKFLKGFIFKNFTQLFRYLLIFIVVVFFGYISTLISDQDMFGILISTVVILISSILLYRVFKVFNYEDIERYFEKNRKVKIILSKILLN